MTWSITLCSRWFPGCSRRTVRCWITCSSLWTGPLCLLLWNRFWIGDGPRRPGRHIQVHWQSPHCRFTFTELRVVTDYLFIVSSSSSSSRLRPLSVPPLSAAGEVSAGTRCTDEDRRGPAAPCARPASWLPPVQRRPGNFLQKLNTETHTYSHCVVDCYSSWKLSNGEKSTCLQTHFLKIHHIMRPKFDWYVICNISKVISLMYILYIHMLFVFICFSGPIKFIV